MRLPTATPNDVLQGLRALEVANSRFNEATEPRLVDAAIHEVTAAELRFSALLSEKRSLFCLEGLDRSTNGGKRC